MPPKPREERADWTSTAEGILLDGLKDANANGLGGDNNFQPQVYHNISAKLLAAGFKLSAEQVKSRWTRVREYHGSRDICAYTEHSWKFKGGYNICKMLRSKSGFGWDDVKKCVTATEPVWHDVLYDKVCIFLLSLSLLCPVSRDGSSNRMV